MRPKGLNSCPHPFSLFDPEVALHLTKLIITAELQNSHWHTNGKETNIPSIAAVSLDHLKYIKVLFLLQTEYFYTSWEIKSVCATEISTFLITVYLGFTESWLHFTKCNQCTGTLLGKCMCTLCSIWFCKVFPSPTAPRLCFLHQVKFVCLGYKIASSTINNI